MSQPRLAAVERDPVEDWHHSLKMQAVEVANRIRPKLKGDFAAVRALVDANELVLGVWQDPAEPNGVGMMIVKGQQLLREIVADGEPLRVGWTAIPCVEWAQAEALRREMGEVDRLQ